MKIINTILLISVLLTSCEQKKSEEKKANDIGSEELQLSDDSILNLVQFQTFDYFWSGANENSGLAPERIHMDNIYPENDPHIVTSGGSGFGLMAIIVGVERGFISREEAIQRFEKILNFLEASDRFHGAFPHWWDGNTGKVYPFSKKDNGGDIVETSFMAAGLITVRQFLNQESEREIRLIERINAIWEEIEFDWYTQGDNVMYWHWSPEYGFEMNFPIGGYNECLITYIMAACSPTHSISKEVYEQGWARNDSIRMDTIFMGLETVLDHYEHAGPPVGPLFWAHYSYLGLNPQNLKDQYADYWKLNYNHAMINYKYCIENPNGFRGYGKDSWGLTASYSIQGYAGHNPVRGDVGVISPTAALSSFPYTPKESMAMLRFLYEKHPEFIGEYGPYDAYSIEHDWYTPRYLAIDQGPIPVMIENYRSGLIWKLFMSAPEVRAGLEKLGFSYE